MSAATDTPDVLDPEAAAGLTWSLHQFQSGPGGLTLVGLGPVGPDQQTLVNARFAAANAVRGIGSEDVEDYRRNSAEMTAWREAHAALSEHRRRVEEARTACQRARDEASHAVQAGHDPADPLARGRQLRATLLDLEQLTPAYEKRHQTAREEAQRGYAAAQQKARGRAIALANQRHSEAKKTLLRQAGDAIAAVLISGSAVESARGLSVDELPITPGGY